MFLHASLGRYHIYCTCPWALCALGARAVNTIPPLEACSNIKYELVSEICNSCTQFDPKACKSMP